MSKARKGGGHKHLINKDRFGTALIKKERDDIDFVKNIRNTNPGKEMTNREYIVMLTSEEIERIKANEIPGPKFD